MRVDIFTECQCWEVEVSCEGAKTWKPRVHKMGSGSCVRSKATDKENDRSGSFLRGCEDTVISAITRRIKWQMYGEVLRAWPRVYSCGWTEGARCKENRYTGLNHSLDVKMWRVMQVKQSAENYGLEWEVEVIRVEATRRANCVGEIISSFSAVLTLKGCLQTQRKIVV